MRTSPGSWKRGAGWWEGLPSPRQSPHVLKELGLDIALLTRPDKEAEVWQDRGAGQMSYLYRTVNIWTHRNSLREGPDNRPQGAAPRTTGQKRDFPDLRLHFPHLPEEPKVCPLHRGGKAVCLGSCGKRGAMLGFEFSSFSPWRGLEIVVTGLHS